MRLKYQYDRKHLEAGFWLSAIVILALSNPAAEGHYSLCLFSMMGIEHCLGCGMGHAIGWLFRGNVTASLQAHPMAIPALGVLIWRIYTLLRSETTIKKHKTEQR